MCYLRVLVIPIALHASVLIGCSGLDGEKDSTRSNSGGDANAGIAAASGSGGSVTVVDGAVSVQGGTSGSASSAGNGGVGATAENADASPGDSSIIDASGQERGAVGNESDSAVAGGDASVVVVDGGAQPPLSTGSCCEEHAEPGCDNADTQACVCERLPDCCTTTWDLACTLIVIHKFCEPGVRECVCGPAAEGGWEQTQCCETEWTNFCDETAIIKCGAKAGC